MNPYHKRFINSFASENIIGLFSRYKGAHKEITESWGMFEAAKTHIPNLPEHTTIIVGDGCSPRTGAIFAYYTKTNVISIDPQFNMEHWKQHKKKQLKMGFPIQRLELLKNKIEDIKLTFETPILIIFPHSHANMTLSLGQLKAPQRCVINMPCCEPIPKEYMQQPHIMYKDYHILSPKNEIHIWKNI